MNALLPVFKRSPAGPGAFDDSVAELVLRYAPPAPDATVLDLRYDSTPAPAQLTLLIQHDATPTIARTMLDLNYGAQTYQADGDYVTGLYEAGTADFTPGVYEADAAANAPAVPGYAPAQYSFGDPSFILVIGLRHSHADYAALPPPAGFWPNEALRHDHAGGLYIQTPLQDVTLNLNYGTQVYQAGLSAGTLTPLCVYAPDPPYALDWVIPGTASDLRLENIIAGITELP